MGRGSEGPNDTRGNDDAEAVHGWRHGSDTPSPQEKKRALQEAEERDQALQAKASLAIPLVPETEADRRLAALLKLHTLDCAWLGAQGRAGGRAGAAPAPSALLPAPSLALPQPMRTNRDSSGRRSAAAPGSPRPRRLAPAPAPAPAPAVALAAAS